jgi:NAD(P)-dependent dehydrogenase (short-subunit alcohol dehydrogenase family)
MCLALAARGDSVVAAVRDPASFAVGARITVVALDVTDVASVQAARRAVGDTPIDVLVSNAGLTGGPQRAPGMDLARAERILRTNAFGPLVVYDAFVDLVRASERRVIVHVASEAGSLSRFRASKKPEYAMSKAALNALTRWVAAVEPDLVCTSIDPGWTRTATGGDDAPQAPALAAAHMIAAIDRLSLEHSGGFVDTSLTAIPW